MSDQANIPQEMAFVKPKKRWPIVLALILCALLLVFAVMSVVVALADFQHGEIPTIFGWGICSSNGEYEPIDKNAAILMRKINNADVVAEGDVVLFYYEGARANHKVYAGQVLENNEETLHVYINEDLADVEISRSVLRGEVHYYVGHVGYVLNIIEDRYGVILSIALVVLLLSVMILLIGSYMSIKEQRKIAAALNDAKDHVDGLSYAETGEQESVDIEEDDTNEEAHSEQIIAVQPIIEDSTEGAIDEVAQESASMEITQGTAVEEPAAEPLPETAAKEPAVKTEKELVETDEAASIPTIQSGQAVASVEENEIVAKEENQAEEATAMEEEPIKEETPLEEQQTAIVPEEVEASEKEMPYNTNMMFLFTVPEATLLKRLLEVAAEKREGSQIVAEVDDRTPALRVNCGTEDVAYVNAIVAAFKKRRNEKV